MFRSISYAVSPIGLGYRSQTITLVHSVMDFVQKLYNNNIALTCVNYAVIGSMSCHSTLAASSLS